MIETSRQLSGLVACVGFLTMSAVGMAFGVSPFYSGLRALGGAVLLYIMMKICCRIVWKIIVDVVARQQVRNSQIRSSGNDNRSG